MLGVKGGFIQLNHGKRAPLQRLSSYPDGEPLQSFTAIGRVKSGEVYQVAMTSRFKPFRADVTFLKAKEAPIRPDFALIAAAMGRDFRKDFAP
jgi:hypothetical protein